MTSIAEPLSQPYHHTLTQLSEASIRKFFLPYSDIDWDAPGNRIDLSDDGWAQTDDLLLARSDWYQQLPQATRNRLGLQIVVDSARLGVMFENILTRGLLLFAKRLPSGSAEYRYAMHEAIEECHHSMMFQEFVNRSGLTPAPEDRRSRIFGGMVVRMAGYFPELFFMFVLGGEAPIDYVQRRSLRNGHKLPPLLRQIMQIHTTEEARHLHFAERYLREYVPRMGKWRKRLLALVTPGILADMASMMMRVAPSTAREFGIPDAALRQAYDDNPQYRTLVAEAFADIVSLCRELGLTEMSPSRMWRALEAQLQ